MKNYATIPFALLLCAFLYAFVDKNTTSLTTIGEQMKELGNNLSDKTERGVYDTLLSSSGYMYQYTYFEHEEMQLLCCKNITSYDDSAEFASVQILYNSLTENVTVSGTEPVIDGDGASDTIQDVSKRNSCALHAVEILLCATNPAACIK